MPLHDAFAFVVFWLALLLQNLLVLGSLFVWTAPGGFRQRGGVQDWRAAQPR
jgi:hypothetical protein